MRIRNYALVLLAAMALGLLAAVSPASASSHLRSVTVQVNGSILAVNAYSIDGRTVVPLRAIFERLNATTEWNDQEKSVTATKGTTVIKLWLGRTEAMINGETVALSAPATSIHGSTYVPLRFVSEALGAEVGFDSERNLVEVTLGGVGAESGCTVSAGQKHSGTIRPGGETWGLCGSPHYVDGAFLIEGEDSPVLVIEAGAVVRFKQGASIQVAQNAPGGLVVEGTAEQPVVFTADTAGAQPGFWEGIVFYPQTAKGRATLEHARVEYAGSYYGGAVTLEGDGGAVEATLKHTELKHSLHAGVLLRGSAKLSDGSGALTITGTKASEEGGGAPFMTSAYGTHRLPDGKYEGNEHDAVRVSSYNSGEGITTNTTWRNIGIPYYFEEDIYVGGSANPTLTIEPGVTTQWARETGLYVGEYGGRGGLMAVGTAESPVVFTSDLLRPGAWSGIRFGPDAGGKNVGLKHTVVEYAVNGVSFAEDPGPVVSDSVLRHNKQYGITYYADAVGTDFTSGFGNTFQGNGEDLGLE